MRLISKALHLFYLGGIIFKLDHKNRASLRWLHSKWLYPVSRVWDAVNDAICLCYMAQGRLIEVHIELSNLRLNLYRFSLRTVDKTPVTLIVPTLKSVSGLFRVSECVRVFISECLRLSWFNPSIPLCWIVSLFGAFTVHLILVWF